MQNLTVEQLKEIVKKIFKNNGIYPIISIPLTRTHMLDDEMSNLKDYNKLPSEKRYDILQMICKGNYDESQIAYIQLSYNLFSGFAFTIDSICIGGKDRSIEESIIKYTDIESLYSDEKFIYINTKTSKDYKYELKKDVLFIAYNTNNKIKEYIEIVKNILNTNEVKQWNQEK